MKATYMLHFKLEGYGDDITQRNFKANSAGEAFAECLKKYPKARLIRAVREGKFNDGWGKTEFLPPPKY